MSVTQTIVAQISDPHIKRPGERAYGVVDTAEALRTCVAFLNDLRPRPSIVVVSGDLVDFGRPEEYRHFRELMLPLAIPFVILPGNHDDRQAMREAFPDHTYLTPAGPLNAHLEQDDIDILLVDSSVPAKPYGTLGPETVHWLDAKLGENPDRPALIFLHHPPILTGVEHMDVQNLLDADALAAVLRRRRRVRLVAAGHVHRTSFSCFAGVPVVTAMGVSHAVALDLDPTSPPAFRMEVPGIYLHRWTPRPGFRPARQPRGPDRRVRRAVPVLRRRGPAALGRLSRATS